MKFNVGNNLQLRESAEEGASPEAIGRKVVEMYNKDPRLRINLPPVPEQGTWTAKFGYKFEHPVPVSWSSDEIIRLFRFCKQEGVHFHVLVYGPQGPKITLGTVQNILDVASDCCEGFEIGEVYNGRTFVEADVPYAQGKEQESVEFLKSLIELAKEAGKKVFWTEHCHDGPGRYAGRDDDPRWRVGWWGFALCDTDIFKEFFDGRYADTLVMTHETNDPRCLPINLMTVLGTWLSGGVSEWGFNLQSWFWNDARFGTRKIPEKTEDFGETAFLNCQECPPDLIFRQALEAVGLGAQYIQFAPDNMIWEQKSENRFELARQYREGIKPFFELLDKGIISPPAKDRIRSFSPLALRLTANNPTHVWRDGLFSSGDPMITPESKNLPTAEVYLPRYIYGEEKLYRGILLKTPYGIVPFLPPWASKETLDRFDEVFDTNSKEIMDPISGQSRKGLEACSFLVERLKAARDKMLVGSHRVGLHLWEEDGFYKAILIRGLFSQREEVELDLNQLQGYQIEDAETGEPITKTDGKAKVKLSKRGHRILKLYK